MGGKASVVKHKPISSDRQNRHTPAWSNISQGTGKARELLPAAHPARKNARSCTPLSPLFSLSLGSGLSHDGSCSRFQILACQVPGVGITCIHRNMCTWRVVGSSTPVERASDLWCGAHWNWPPIELALACEVGHHGADGDFCLQHLSLRLLSRDADMVWSHERRPCSSMGHGFRFAPLVGGVLCIRNVGPRIFSDFAAAPAPACAPHRQSQ